VDKNEGDRECRGAETTRPNDLVKAFFARKRQFPELTRKVFNFSLLYWLITLPHLLSVVAMKLLFAIVAVLALNSCNTLIGMGRDTKQGYQWTKGKIQGSGQSQHQDHYGAPVY
jgi:predicted small secreted protein